MRLFLIGLLVLIIQFSEGGASPVFERLHAFGLSPSEPTTRLIQGSDGSLYGTTTRGGGRDHGTIFKVTAAGVVTTLVNFTDTNGSYPSGFIKGRDGNFYGTTLGDGWESPGTAFRMTAEGELMTLASFVGDNGSEPCGLVEGRDGNFYGVTRVGGSHGLGTIFMMKPSGRLTTLVNFNLANGSYPTTGLVQGLDGNFYGTSGEAAAAFKVTPAGKLTTLVKFSETAIADPNHPGLIINPNGMILGNDGNFYGTTQYGGSDGNGTVFKMTPAGEVTKLADFTTGIGSNPLGELMPGSDGSFYGTTSGGGANRGGTVFKITPEGRLTVLACFVEPFREEGGFFPTAGLVEGKDGNFYGTTGQGGVDDAGTVFRMTAAGTLTTLANMTTSSGSYPMSGLVKGKDGNFYGTTPRGGRNGMGTIFRMTVEGRVTTLVNFRGANGSTPYAGLIEGNDGNFYGTTSLGGSSDFGTVFKMTPEGRLTTLVDLNYFSGIAWPQAGLAQGRDGNFYGTTSGAVYKMTPSGEMTVLVNFNGANGLASCSGLVEGRDGDFYGTTSEGGISGMGTVFKIAAAGELTTLVHFTGTDGNFPEAGLLLGDDSCFYGTTSKGGKHGKGTIFRMTRTGKLTTLFDFSGPNGQMPRAGLLQYGDGNFYGVTYLGGGSDSDGTLFKMTPAGQLTILMKFNNGRDGSNPDACLVEGDDGHLYGTTNTGGSTSDGEYLGGGQLFRLRFGPTVATRPAVHLGSRSITLNARVDPRGYRSPVAFQFGTSADLKSFSTIDAGVVRGDKGSVSVRADVNGLLPGVRYYFRVVARNAENRTPQKGAIMSCKTASGSLVPFAKGMR